MTEIWESSDLDILLQHYDNLIFKYVKVNLSKDLRDRDNSKSLVMWQHLEVHSGPQPYLVTQLDIYFKRLFAQFRLANNHN